MQVVIANPGAVSWMLESAEAFAAEGELERYFAPVVVGSEDLEKIARSRLPGPLRRRLVSELERRTTRNAVGDRIGRVATSIELANVLLLRSPLPLKGRRALFRRRMEAFDAGVSRRLHPGVSVVIGYQGAATRTFRRARALGIRTVLDYPAAHYETVERTYGEEADLNPEFAPALIRGYPDWLRRRYAEEIAGADRIITLSSFQRRTFADAGVDLSKTFLAPLCADTEVFTPAPEPPPPAPFRVAFCGQIGQHKGISYLIEGFNRAELGPDAELLMIGGGIAHSLWADRPGVRHVPPMPRSRLPEVLRTCHVIVLPSLSEGFGAAPLEGMACGLPAIVSDRTFADDVIDDGVEGWVIPIRDPEAIAERLQRLHDDPELRMRMGRAARAKAEQYPWRRYREALRAGVIELAGE